MHEIAIAIPCPLPQTFTYRSKVPLKRGQRVRVAFGNRQSIGVVWDPAPPALEKSIKLKEVIEIIDDEPVYSPTMLSLAEWISNYYFHPIGEVLKTMLPLGDSKQSTPTTWQLKTRQSDSSVKSEANINKTRQSGFDEAVAEIFGKRLQLSENTLLQKFRRWQQSHISEEKDWLQGKEFLALMVKRGLVSPLKDEKRGPKAKVRQEPTAQASLGPLALGEKPQILLAPQTSALAKITDEVLNNGAAKPMLLYGITGSGKTEVFLHAIEKIAAHYPDQNSQFLVLVPEISLTPQTTATFDRRFPGTLAVVHSGQSPTHRWAELERVRSGQARILIGPRSAVFAPFACLKLIIVDEEHDASYKQASGLSYNGRDIAVLRAKFENAGVLLASATPSLESYQNALSERYHLIRMDQRATGAPLPSLTWIPSSGLKVSAEGLTKETDAAKSALDSQIIAALAEQLKKGEQSLVLVNRRGWAYYLYDYEKKETVVCPNCSICLTLHRANQRLVCHYCDYNQSLSAFIQANNQRKFIAIGSGSQKIEAQLKELLPQARILRIDSDLAKSKDYLSDSLAAFGRGEVDILVGTQMLAKGHDFAKLTLTVLLDLDEMLCFPDFRASERTFSLMVQAAGRAGRSHLEGKVLLSGRLLGHPVLTKALAQDYIAFAQEELALRQKLSYPPFSKMILFTLSSQYEDNLDRFCANLENFLANHFSKNPPGRSKIRVLGPTTSALAKINRRHRKLLVLVSKELPPLRQLADLILRGFQRNKLNVLLQIDVDPINLL